MTLVSQLYKSISFQFKSLFFILTFLALSLGLANAQDTIPKDRDLENLLKLRPLNKNQKAKLKVKLNSMFTEQIKNSDSVDNLEPNLKSSWTKCTSNKIVDALWISPEFQKSPNSAQSILLQELKLNMNKCFITTIGQDMVNNPGKYISSDGETLKSPFQSKSISSNQSVESDSYQSSNVENPSVATEDEKNKLSQSIEPIVRERAAERYEIDQLSDPMKWQLYSCASKKLTDIALNSTAYRNTRSLEAIQSTEVFDEAITGCASLEIKSSTSKAPSSANPRGGNYGPFMDFNDLYVDYNNIVGNTVNVKGFLITSGEYSIMTQSIGATAMLFVDTSELTRDERKHLLSRCSSGCDISLKGTVNNVQYQKGIIAKKLYQN